MENIKEKDILKKKEKNQLKDKEKEKEEIIIPFINRKSINVEESKSEIKTKKNKDESNIKLSKKWNPIQLFCRLNNKNEDSF